jgi:catalase
MRQRRLPRRRGCPQPQRLSAVFGSGHPRHGAPVRLWPEPGRARHGKDSTRAGAAVRSARRAAAGDGDAPVFFAARPEDFAERQQADLPDPATGQRDPAKAAADVAKHPEFKTWANWFAGHTAPASYAKTTFNSVHAFLFIDAAKQSHPVKWRFVPRDGERYLTDAEYAAAPKTFLEPGLMERVQKGPIAWEMMVSLGEPGDPLDNPTLLWPADRREIDAGTLTLTKAEPQSTGACDPIMFDPNLDSAGIEPSKDPILAFRSLAYAVSYGRRTEEKSK